MDMTRSVCRECAEKALSDIEEAEVLSYSGGGSLNLARRVLRASIGEVRLRCEHEVLQTAQS